MALSPPLTDTQVDQLPSSEYCYPACSTLCRRQEQRRGGVSQSRARSCAAQDLCRLAGKRPSLSASIARSQPTTAIMASTLRHRRKVSDLGGGSAGTSDLCVRRRNHSTRSVPHAWRNGRRSSARDSGRGPRHPPAFVDGIGHHHSPRIRRRVRRSADRVFVAGGFGLPVLLSSPFPSGSQRNNGAEHT